MDVGAFIRSLVSSALPSHRQPPVDRRPRPLAALSSALSIAVAGRDSNSQRRDTFPRGAPGDKRSDRPKVKSRADRQQRNTETDREREQRRLTDQSHRSAIDRHVAQLQSVRCDGGLRTGFVRADERSATDHADGAGTDGGTAAAAADGDHAAAAANAAATATAAGQNNNHTQQQRRQQQRATSSRDACGHAHHSVSTDSSRLCVCPSVCALSLSRSNRCS